MALLNFIISTVGKCMDAIFLLLDVNFIIVHSVVRTFLMVFTFIFNLPTFLMNSLLQLGDLLLFWTMSLADLASYLSEYTISVLVKLGFAVEGLLESLKMIGYLSVHVLLRGKEHLYRCLVSLMEGCGIAVSLVVYFTNTVVNFALIATQNAYLTVVAVCQTMSSPLQKILELALTSFTFLYSSLAGTSAFLWCRCKLLLDFLVSLLHMFISIFMLNIYGFLLTVAIALTATVFLNPRLSHRAARSLLFHINSIRLVRRFYYVLYRMSSALRNGRQCLRRSIRHLQFIVRDLHLFERGLWHQLSRQSVYLSHALRIQFHRIHNGEQDDGNLGGARRDPPERRDGHENDQQTASVATPSTSTLIKHSSIEDSKNLPTESLLNLLRDQEERKKCVICQDCTKTVVLLPCRHLCLCKDCKNILLNQPIYQQNCPLCRQMILNAMDVYV